jgi:repressor LexA
LAPSNRQRRVSPAPGAPTARQRRVLAFIAAFAARRGFPPTHAEIAAGLKFASANAAREHVRLLAQKGLIEVTPGASRGLKLIESEAEPERRAFAAPDFGLPLIGRVAAGAPILAVENVERTVAVDPAAFRPRADYLLRVRGDSMIEAGVLDGDLVAVSRASKPAAGAIAVVRLDDEVTVKRWRPEGRRLVLEPANASLKPIVVDPSRTAVAVEGVVVGVLRLDAGRGAR